MKKCVMLLGLVAPMAAMAQDDEPVKPFSMDGEFGLIVTTGNTESSTMKAKLSAHQELEMWSNDFSLEGLYKQDEDDDTNKKETTAQNIYMAGQANYKLSNPNHRLFLFGSYEDDRFSSYNYQSTLALGWSERLWETKKTKFEYSIGPGYAFVETDEDEDESSVILRGSMDFHWKISESANFSQLVSTEYGQYNTKSRSETALTAKINGSLAMKLSLTMDHNSNVSSDTEKLDTTTAVTLVYTFF